MCCDEPSDKSSAGNGTPQQRGGIPETDRVKQARHERAHAGESIQGKAVCGDRGWKPGQRLPEAARQGPRKPSVLGGFRQDAGAELRGRICGKRPAPRRGSFLWSTSYTPTQGLRQRCCKLLGSPFHPEWAASEAALSTLRDGGGSGQGDARGLDDSCADRTRDQCFCRPSPALCCNPAGDPGKLGYLLCTCWLSPGDLRL